MIVVFVCAYLSHVPCKHPKFVWKMLSPYLYCRFREWVGNARPCHAAGHGKNNALVEFFFLSSKLLFYCFFSGSEHSWMYRVYKSSGNTLLRSVNLLIPTQGIGTFPFNICRHKLASINAFSVLHFSNVFNPLQYPSFAKYFLWCIFELPKST